MNIKNNLDELMELMKISAKDANRNPEDVKLIAVTKTVSMDKIKKAIDYGITDIGENKVQEILDKYEYVKDDVKIHLIGTLQTNKVKYIIDKVSLIHSLDKMSLAREIDKRAKAISKIMPCLVQVNISKESTKHGLYENEVVDFIKSISDECKNIKINGLMTMAPYDENPENTRVYFKRLKELSEKIKELQIENVSMDYISMGMSNDFKVAIQEGSTMIRVGSYIFGDRNY